MIRGYCRNCKHLALSIHFNMICMCNLRRGSIMNLDSKCDIDRWQLDDKILEDIKILGTVEEDEIKHPGGIYISLTDNKLYKFKRELSSRYNNIDGFERLN